MVVGWYVMKCARLVIVIGLECACGVVLGMSLFSWCHLWCWEWFLKVFSYWKYFGQTPKHAKSYKIGKSVKHCSRILRFFYVTANLHVFIPQQWTKTWQNTFLVPRLLKGDFLTKKIWLECQVWSKLFLSTFVKTFLLHQ